MVISDFKRLHSLSHSSAGWEQRDIFRPQEALNFCKSTKKSRENLNIRTNKAFLCIFSARSGPRKGLSEPLHGLFRIIWSVGLR